jgi:uncharacterized membrane protein YfcA
MSYAIVAIAALLAGMVNAIAGGGSLISFPALLFVGLSPVAASVTNTVALCPGYLGATLSQRKDLAGQRARIAMIVPLSLIGGVTGAFVLLNTGDVAFGAIVPYLILFAALLLAAQAKLRAWIARRGPATNAERWAAVPIFFAAVYGGYFGAGMGVMVVAVLAILVEDSFTRLNAVKQLMALVVNVSAAVVFVLSGRTNWPLAGVMFASAMAGGWIGGAIATRIPPAVLRWTVVTIGVVIAIIYFVRN